MTTPTQIQPWQVYPITPPPKLSTWTQINMGTTTASDSNGGIFLDGPSVAAEPLCAIIRPAPATPYIIKALIQTWTYSANFTRVGLLLRDSGTGKFITFGMTQSINWNTEDYWTASNSWSSRPASFPTNEQPNLHWWGVGNDGTSVTLQVSADGIHWAILKTESKTAFLANITDVGVFISPQAGYVGAQLISWSGA